MSYDIFSPFTITEYFIFLCRSQSIILKYDFCAPLCVRMCPLHYMVCVRMFFWCLRSKAEDILERKFTILDGKEINSKAGITQSGCDWSTVAVVKPNATPRP